MPYARCTKCSKWIDWSNTRGSRLKDIEHCKGFPVERITYQVIEGRHPLINKAERDELKNVSGYTRRLDKDGYSHYAYKAKSGIYVRDNNDILHLVTPSPDNPGNEKEAGS